MKGKVIAVISLFALMALCVFDYKNPIAYPTPTACGEQENADSATYGPVYPQQSVKAPNQTTSETTAIETTTAETTTVEVTEETLKDMSPEMYVELVKYQIDGQVGENETIEDVTYDKGNKLLTIYVNIDNAEIPQNFTIEDIAISRFSSITDEILNSEMDFMWNKIIVDYGKVGKIEVTEKNICEYDGFRYFDYFDIT